MLKEFLDLVCDQVNKGIYVWGGNGENLLCMSDPEAWIRKRETTKANANRAIALFENRVADGIDPIRAFDCSGLVYWALHELGLQQSDVSSRGLYSLCERIEKTELRPGDLVFHHDGTRIVHVGVWANDGYQIECRGRDVGVVCNKRSSGYWNRFGRWKTLVPGPEPAPKQMVYVKGKSVNVRVGDSVKSAKMGVAHRGNEFPLLGYGASGWYQIAYLGRIGYISNRFDLTELR